MHKLITRWMALAIGLVGFTASAQSPPASPDYRPAAQGTELDLQRPFHTLSPWRLVVKEGPQVKDYGENDAPGALSLCLQKGPKGPCQSSEVTPALRTPADNESVTWEPHYLVTAKPVYPGGPSAAPFLLIVTGSLNSGDGDQLVATQLVAYDAGRDVFHRIYDRNTERNNNQEIRFVDHGPLRGSVISAEPQEHLPYGYWIDVESLTRTGTYGRVLHYPSATRYGDGNRLAVIDSEMPTIERKLGLWKPGDPLPVPATNGEGKPCSKPVLKRSELWCE